MYINITLVSKFLLNEKVGNLVNTTSEPPSQEKIVNPRLCNKHRNFHSNRSICSYLLSNFFAQTGRQMFHAKLAML